MNFENNNLANINYNLLIDVQDHEKNSYKGKVEISFDLLDLENKFTIFADSKLIFTEIDEKKFGKLTFERKKDSLDIFLPEKYQGPLTISIDFVGSISERTCRGIYKRKNVIYTQFEPDDARKCFPCFDYHFLRARFTLTVVSETNQNVFTNTKINTEEILKNYKITKFKTTSDIPIYTFCFCIGEFTLHSSNDFIRVFLRSEKKDFGNGDTILKDATECMKLMEKEFKFSFKNTGVDKLDLILVPSYPYFGMENHGCIFLQENMYMGYSDYRTEIIVHEMVHHFIGNLVGLQTWVKEGITSFYQKKITDSYYKKESSINYKIKEKIPIPSDPTPETGLSYEECFNWAIQKVNELGQEEFQKRIQKMIEIYKNQYLPTKLFLELFE